MPALLKRRFRRSMTFAAAARRRIQQFGPYKSLAVLLVPLLIVEPVKMAGLAFVGFGHWAGGACMIVGAYAAGLLFLDRLYRVVKSNLYAMEWYAVLADRFQATLARWRWRRVESSRVAGVADSNLRHNGFSNFHGHSAAFGHGRLRLNPVIHSIPKSKQSAFGCVQGKIPSEALRSEVTP
jgi:hypothetical protein